MKRREKAPQQLAPAPELRGGHVRVVTGKPTPKAPDQLKEAVRDHP